MFNIMTPGEGVLVLRRDHLNHIVKLHLLLYQYTAHRLLLYEGIMVLLSFPSVEFYLFYDGAVEMQI